MNDPMLEKLLHSKKYQGVCPDTVRRIYSECLGKYKKPKDAEKAAREALHGITGAFLTREEAARCMSDLEVWASQGREDAPLERALERHASTRERLPLARTDAMYRRIFEVVGVLNAAADRWALPIHAVCGDLLCENAIPEMRFHAALLFKILPLLERQRAGSAMAVMNAIDADYLVVSVPTRPLGGHNVGMEAHYSDWMDSHLPENRTIAARFVADNELFYILKEN